MKGSDYLHKKKAEVSNFVECQACFGSSILWHAKKVSTFCRLVIHNNFIFMKLIQNNSHCLPSNLLLIR